VTDERAQRRLLTGTFFRRLFESELMPPGLAQLQLVVGTVAFLAAPAAILPLLLAKKYMFLHGDALRVTMAQDRVIAIVLSMAATALVTLVIWENIFPDRRDSRHLGMLPIRLRTFVAARLAALVGLFGVVFLGPTLLSAISFGIVGAAFSKDLNFFQFAFGHFATIASAEGFVFFSIVAAQCVGLSLLGPNVAQRAAVTVQVLLVILLLQMPMLLPPGSSYALQADGAPAWRDIGPVVVSPPFWFLSLFDCIAGYGCGAMAPLPQVAAGLGIGTPLAALGLYAASYRRLTRLAIEGRPLSSGSAWSAFRAGISWLAEGSARTPAAVAVCGFTLRTLIRSRQHRMLLAGWIGLALALILSSMVSLFVRSGIHAFDHPRTEPLAAPLILSVLVLAGIRMVMALPTEVKANWAFKLRQPRDLAHALDGAAAAFVVAGVLPAMLLGWVSATWLWGPLVGLQHALFVGVLGFMVVQLLMRGVDKIPFTCTYYPGRAKFTKFWPAYLTAFTTLTYTAASLEAAVLSSLRGYVVLVAVVGGMAVALRWSRRREAGGLPALRFEEEPAEQMTVVTLN
jgi:hypothetical protein